MLSEQSKIIAHIIATTYAVGATTAAKGRINRDPIAWLVAFDSGACIDDDSRAIAPQNVGKREVKTLPALDHPEIKTVEGRGFICKVKDHMCLAESINRALDDHDLCSELTRKAHEHCLKTHSVDTMTESYISIYKQLAT